jgi:uncharacterized protein YciI
VEFNPLPDFVLYCLDREGSAEAREIHRDPHIGHVRRPGVTKLAGPMLDADGRIVGSLLIIEADDLAAAKAFAAEDPYSLADVFERVDVRPLKLSYIAL